MANLHLESLRYKPTTRSIKLALKKLPKGSEALSKAYDKAVIRIESQDIENKSLAMKTLAWLIYSHRQLTLLQLHHALAVETNPPADEEGNDDEFDMESLNRLDQENIPDPDIILSACAGLVVIDKRTTYVRLVHYTAQEYFMKLRTSWLPDAETQITIVCLTYLSYDDFCTGNIDAHVKSKMALWEYAARFWAAHAPQANSSYIPIAVNFLVDNVKRLAYIRELRIRSEDNPAESKSLIGSGSSRTAWIADPPTFSPCHLAAHFGLVDLWTLLEKVDSPCI